MWYLVKKNWQPVEAIISEAMLPKTFLYCGVGGDAWPLEGSPEPKASLVHECMMKTRTCIEFQPGLSGLVCCDYKVAQEYLAVANAVLGKCMLLGLEAEGSRSVGAKGYDFGSPTGGYSLIETEIIVQRSEALMGCLNSCGLFEDLDTLQSYLMTRNDDASAEDVNFCMALAIVYLEM